MNNEKLDNFLNLALDATDEERDKSEELSVGYHAADKTWQLIVRASGSMAELSETYPEVEIDTLLNGYAVMTVPQDLIDEVSQRPEIEYMEKPKRLFFAVNEGRRVSCVNSLQQFVPYETGAGNQLFPVPVSGETASEDPLLGAGVLAAIIDSGIDYAHPDFRNADGTTRIVELFDQVTGEIYDAAQINEALAQPTETER
ncbi:MAG: hypothetical protein LIO75_05835 [Lachnospiraceae bacterium]|nr:hypothetical protein [Lachnospiraceae bacterium]